MATHWNLSVTLFRLSYFEHRVHAFQRIRLTGVVFGPALKHLPARESLSNRIIASTHAQTRVSRLSIPRKSSMLEKIQHFGEPLRLRRGFVWKRTI